MEIDYQRNSATLVTSDDNGAGKSTMLVWLLFFVLYNDTYSKKEKKAGLVNSQNKRNAWVKLSSPLEEVNGKFVVVSNLIS
ncbi:recombination-related endonuclease [Salmonella phage 38]|uniref:Recombination-related endonuclease n=1 Tax=Salmonella phage 38 TaxID=1654891 RepID=A0A0N7CER7_9CAUD|nr:recombination-related endonuclease [Salmonella phage 38]AKJ73751.1 recombination-related endonuclease [Salmonella phage 38]